MNKHGKTYWRSLHELQETPEFKEFLHREFPTAASEFPDGVSRRRWMQLMGASLALGGLAGCRWEAEKIAPFAVRPENRIPGEPEQFATSIEIAGMPRQLLVTCYDGRPVKIEGNPEHPDSQGATDTFSQATILSLYDPDRSDNVRQHQRRDTFTRTWDEFDKFFDAKLSELASQQGRGLAVLLEPSSSVTQKTLLRKLKERFPAVQLFGYSPLGDLQQAAATKRVFGKRLRPSLHLDKAQRIACFDIDLLALHPTALRNAAGFAAGRDPDQTMNRLYSVESQFSVTGAAADHRLPMKSGNIAALLGLIETYVSQALDLQPLTTNATANTFPTEVVEFARVLAEDLVAHRGESIVVVGTTQPDSVQDLALHLNARLGNVGKTISLLPAFRDAMGDLRDLKSSVTAGQVDTLLMLGGNPAYDAPHDISFANLLKRIPTTIRAGLYEDETSAVSAWHIPLAHELEAWGDVTAWDGSVSISQPLIAPLLNGRSVIELLAQVAGERREPQAIVREALGDATGGKLSTQRWRRLVHDGFISATSQQHVAAQPAVDFSFQASTISDEVEVVFTTSSSCLDGRFANNGWMQETPDFLTKLTWDNAALVSTSTAERLGLQHGKFARITVGGQEIAAPVYVMPGQANNSIGLAMGYGRTLAGKIGGDRRQEIESVGIDVTPIRSVSHPFVRSQVQVQPVSRDYEFATTQDHHAIDTVGMEEIGQRVGALVREGSYLEYKEHPDFVKHAAHHHGEIESLWKEPSYDGHAWGMAIDLNKCIGCNACTVACQAENNVPIVGKEQVAMGREMHWIRTDRYFAGDVENPQVAHQPVACHHCENAPCEQVCPVAATVHSDEGLNDMVYNRCIGTRYCGNNCPYKVRRFNFFDYNKDLESANRQLAQLSVNPEVTVRSRGVMEKCTYCVQRIQKVKIDAKTGRRIIEDGEIKTACQQACASQAIEFGDLNDPTSRVAKAHANNRAYGMLEELNVKPRTQYLARIRNPHPQLVPADTHHAPSKPHHDVEHAHGHG